MATTARRRRRADWSPWDRDDGRRDAPGVRAVMTALAAMGLCALLAAGFLAAVSVLMR